jgi:outer membrane lipoprotein SlyB
MIFDKTFKCSVVGWILALAGLAGCAATNDGQGVYRVQSVGNAQRSMEAVVLTSKPVLIVRANSGAGANAGGLAGGVIAAENSDNAGVIIAGIIAGAVIGDAIESTGNRFNGREYVIETSRGVILTVAQVDDGSDIFEAADNVILVYGYPHRLIKDPRKQ